jgi:hypothetical protein
MQINLKRKYQKNKSSNSMGIQSKIFSPVEIGMEKIK